MGETGVCTFTSASDASRSRRDIPRHVPEIQNPNLIDLRSDTVTRPTPAMREAMATAEVGDDVFNEDPTVLRLQARVAELLGKEAALFVPSGTMSNQLGLRVLTEPGDEVIVERNAHVFNYESGAGAYLSGVQFQVVEATRGRLTPEQVRGAIRAGYYWEPRTRVLWLENTVNRAGGVVLDYDEMCAAVDVAREHGLATHLDGARLWNAAVASGRSEKAWAAPFDTVSVCLSKGLGAPVGSLLAGSAAHIEKAHRFRKMLGGGMRQVGILAAAGLHALDHHRARLADDHTHARRLAEAIAQIPALAIDLDTVETNIVLFDVPGDAAQTAKQLAERGLGVVPFGPRRLRATTHLGVTPHDIDDAITLFRSFFA